MKDRKKRGWIQLIAGIILLLFIFSTPEFAVLVSVGWVVFYVGKQLWHVPIGSIKKKK